MNKAFQAHVDALPDLLERLLAMPPVKVCELPKAMPKHGVYVLTERSRHLYVGRSNRLKTRLGEHGRPSSPATKSAFVFRLAREATGRTKASYKPKGSRNQLMQDARFRAEFVKAKERISQMNVRYVEESHPVRQALLEMYVALTLETPYNSFDNH
jgi:hypothetical protein